MDVATLLVSCPDRKGIVASLAQVLYGHGANIVDSDQHTDPIAGMFFQRIRFDLSTLSHRPRALEARAAPRWASEFGMDWRLSSSRAAAQRVAIFCSKQEHCLYDLLIRHRAGELPCEIAMVISNHPDARADRAALRRAVPPPAGDAGDQARAGGGGRSSCSTAPASS